MKSYFPDAVSYNRFIELKKEVNIALYFFTFYMGLGRQTGTYYVDSTKMAACDNHRIYQHKVFKGVAARGKTSTGWFYGLKLHMIINEQGELMSFCFTSGNVSDSNPEVITQLCKHLNPGGKIFGDAGYVSQSLFEMLYEQGLQLFTKIRKNMKNKLISIEDKWLLKKRSLIETVIDIMKNWLDLWHTRHRSIDNGLNNMIACLAAYHFIDHKPTLNQSKRNTLLNLMPVL